MVPAKFSNHPLTRFRCAFGDRFATKTFAELKAHVRQLHSTHVHTELYRARKARSAPTTVTAPSTAANEAATTTATDAAVVALPPPAVVVEAETASAATPVHNPSEQLLCDICARFHTAVASSMRYHMDMHAREGKLFACVACGDNSPVFNSVTQCVIHIRKNHHSKGYVPCVKH